ncbi:MAG: ABC transporter substrate-binding protein [Nitrospira sp.]|nr:ABC transporter substrate-binding protein [Nitrospira sp.]
MADQSNHQRLKSSSPVIAVVDGVTLVEPSGYSPTEVVKHTINDVLWILGNEALKQPGRSEDRRQEIEQVIRRRVSYAHMAQQALGVPWVKLSDLERQEFVGLFVALLRDRVANQIDQYYDEQVFYLVERRDGNFAELRTNLIGPKVDTLLDFRLENHSGEWLVYDVEVDHASIVSNYRSQFTCIVRDLSYAGLVEKMKQSGGLVKSFETIASR